MPPACFSFSMGYEFDVHLILSTPLYLEAALSMKLLTSGQCLTGAACD